MITITTTDEQYELEERAAIMEHEAGVPKDESDALALADRLERLGFMPFSASTNNMQMEMMI